MKEDFLHHKLEDRMASNALRSLQLPGLQTDFFTNDYLGIVKNGLLENLIGHARYAHGSTGSRLLGGNDRLIEMAEAEIAVFHQAATGLILNSGYDANAGLLACIAGKGDLILYDQLSHASIRDGIRQSFADAHAFRHNDLEELEKKIKARAGGVRKNIFVVTESVFSMDGDLAPLKEMASLCEKYGANLIVDEAHATGVVGPRGEGLVQLLGLEANCFARIHTFGKALGSDKLRNFLINFCRPLIYSTALPPVAIAAIRAAYQIFPGMHKEREHLNRLIKLFDRPGFKKSSTPIQCFISPGNDNARQHAAQMQEKNFAVRAILAPTVPPGQERLRITLHSFNSIEETSELVSACGRVRV